MSADENQAVEEQKKDDDATVADTVPAEDENAKAMIVEQAAQPQEQQQKSTDSIDYVVVLDASTNEPIEVPTSEGCVLMSTLQATFPGATGLKYRNPKTGANRVVQVDPNGLRLMAPADGWEDKTFSAIFPPAATPTASTRTARGADAAGGAKRRKVNSSDQETDSDDETDGRSRSKRAVQQQEAKAASTATAPPEPEQSVDLIVLGVDFKTSDETFRNYFEEFGKVVYCEIKRKPDGVSKGFGFVRMETVDEQNKVLAVALHEIDGRRCDVKIPEARDKGNKTMISRIFVGRLTDRISEEMLRDAIDEEAKKVSDSVKITDVFIPKPFRGFAFVTLSSGEVAFEVVKKGSLMINGTSLALSLALPREEPKPDYGPPSSDYGLPAGYGYRRHADRGYSKPSSQYSNFSRNDYSPYSRGGGGGSGPPAQNSDRDRRYWDSSPNHRWGEPDTRLPPPPRPPPQPLMSIRSGPIDPRRAPPYHQQHHHHHHHRIDDYGPTGSAQTANIAFGLDALDLNQTNPEIVNAALSAFFTTLAQPRNNNIPPPTGPPRKWN
ncbi:unnamed protein product [Caenorhabditis bovis]|uniref:RRM domain-containing protein n=1 Tax=Caenorhabditis bovis TaxID=2654633 RepID=A0A8S1EZW1_9PELO|nr:unnamed protein product [Caenorhabditis bovis]